MINIFNKIIKVVYALDSGGGGRSLDTTNLNGGGGRSLDAINLPDDPTGFTDIGSIISKLLPYIYVVAGLILLLMLISGGIGLMTSAGNPDKSKASYGRITGALIGFVIIFVSYFVAKIVETILGVKFM